MDSNTHQIYDQNSQPHSGLLRLRSAPSSLIASFTGNGVLDKTGGFEPDRLQISRFMSSDADLESPNARDFAVTPQHQNQSYASLPPHYPRPNGAVSSSAMDDVSYQFLSTKPLNSNLARQSSSPAGMFTNLHVQHGGYGSMKNMMSYESSTRPPSSLGMVSQISEIGNANSAFRSQYDHWNDQSSLMENLPGVKMESQNGEGGNHVQLLSHHLSLPKTSSEMAAMEKIFQMNDSVPFKIRAKRGCATHPRSIAERVRRTKISERMRKLQELVPNMDKQMNTADMLDLAVEYIKALQGQFKMLSDNQANCKCKNTEKKPIQNQMV